MKRILRLVAVMSGVVLCNWLLAQDIFSEQVLDIHIDFKEQNWREILMKAREDDDKFRLESHVTINGVEYPGVQVRFKGNSSYNAVARAGYEKLPLNLKAQDDALFAGGYETLKLANNFRDPSAVREVLAYRIAGSYVPVPKCTFAAVYVNGNYLGVYTATEGINKNMVSRYFCYRKRGLVQAEPDFRAPTPPGCKQGNYASLEYLGDDPKCYERLYQVKDKEGWQYLIRLARVLNDSTDHIEDVLDVHLALWMHALNNVLVNLDSYLGFFCHNYYLFLDTADIYHPLMWDFNLAFGGFPALKSNVAVDFETLSPIVHERYDLQNRPLITELLKNRTYRNLYFSMMRTILDDWFSNNKYAEVAEELHKEISPYMQQEKHGFYSYADFAQNLDKDVKIDEAHSIPGLFNLMKPRTTYLESNPLLANEILRVDNWYVSSATDSVNVRIRVSGNVSRARLWAQTSGCRSFAVSEMHHEPFTQDYTCKLASRPIEFYIELSGESSANLWPLQAPRKLLQVPEDDASQK